MDNLSANSRQVLQRIQTLRSAALEAETKETAAARNRVGFAAENLRQTIYDIEMSEKLRDEFLGAIQLVEEKIQHIVAGD